MAKYFDVYTQIPGIKPCPQVWVVEDDPSEKKYHHRAGIHSRWRPKTRHINLSRVEAIKSDHEWRNRKQHHQISRILDKLILWELDHD